jgi:hypothetical protein
MSAASDFLGDCPEPYKAAVSVSRAPQRLLEFCTLYDRLRAGRTVPHRDDLDLRSLSAFLTDLTLMEMENPETVTYRLMGSDVAERMGADLTGLNFLSYLPESDRCGTAQAMELVTSQPFGLFTVYENHYARGVLSLNESIMLPIATGSGCHVTQILGLHLSQTPVAYDRERSETLIALTTMSAIPVDLGAGAPSGQELDALGAR